MRQFATALVICLAPAFAGAQLPTRALGPALDAAPEPLSAVSGFRALSDERVLVADAREGTLQAVDFRRGDATPVGRMGAGPGEWANPSSLWAMPGDSTLMEDFANGRFLVIRPDGQPGATFRIADERLASAAGLIGVDAQGQLFLARVVPPPNPGRGVASSGVVEVYRHDRRSGRSEKVAQYAEPAGEVSAARMLPNGMMQLSTNLPLAPHDATAPTPRGELIIVRAAPYRVDRLGADGQLREGPPAEAPRIRVTQAEKEAFLRAQVRPGSIVVRGPTAGGDGGGGAGAIPRSRSPGFTGDVDALFSPDMIWPEYKPPFQSRGVVAAVSGDVWVMRSRAHDDPNPVYDVFGSDGRVRMRVQLAPRSRVVGIGSAVVFVARTDEDDLIHLERHALPR